MTMRYLFFFLMFAASAFGQGQGVSMRASGGFGTNSTFVGTNVIFPNGVITKGANTNNYFLSESVITELHGGIVDSCVTLGGNVNIVGGHTAVAIGGGGNRVVGDGTVVIGSKFSTNLGDYATAIIGGRDNFLGQMITGVMIGGQRNFLEGDNSVNVGGFLTRIDNDNSVVAGGILNQITAVQGFIGGGRTNTIELGGTDSFILGGRSNTVTAANAGIIGGFNVVNNTANSVILGGAVTVVGVQSNLNLAGTGVRFLQADANGKIAAVQSTNLTSGGSGIQAGWTQWSAHPNWWLGILPDEDGNSSIITATNSVSTHTSFRITTGSGDDGGAFKIWNSSNNRVLDTDDGTLRDGTGKRSVDWSNRTLNGSGGDLDVGLDWENRRLISSSGAFLAEWFGESLVLTRVSGGVVMTQNTTATATFNTDGYAETIYDDDATTIASLTINLPSTTSNGEILRYVTKAIITSVTVNGTVSIGASVTSLAANSSVAWQAINDSGTFIRIQ